MRFLQRESNISPMKERPTSKVKRKLEGEEAMQVSSDAFEAELGEPGAARKIMDMFKEGEELVIIQRHDNKPPEVTIYGE